MISRYELIVSRPANTRDRKRAVYLRGTRRIVAHIVEPNGRTRDNKPIGYQAIIKRQFASPHITTCVI